MNASEAILAVVLAGGQARRMGGGDKTLLRVAGRSILARTIETLRPQVARMVLNASGNAARFTEAGLPVVGDSVAGQPGPLAGILAGLDWAAARGAEWVVSVPGDCPFLPMDLVARLHAGLAGSRTRFACAGSGGRVHPVAGLWPVSCRDELRTALAAGTRRVQAFAQPVTVVEWAAEPVDPFFNVNTPEDLAAAEALAAG